MSGKKRILTPFGALFVIAVIIFLLAALLLARVGLSRRKAVVQEKTHPAQEKKDYLYAHLGEKITYEIKFKQLTIGRASFNYLSKAKLNGQPLILMVMETKLANFSDTEKVYGDPQTLLPVKIERHIINLFSREHIIEDYDQAGHSVTIKKTKGKREEAPLVIKRTGPIQNAILLPHYLRRLPELILGMSFKVNLPTREFKIELISIEEVTVPAGTFKAFHFQSTPQQIEVWITADERRIPVKIKGTGAFGYVMAMKKYSSPS